MAHCAAASTAADTTPLQDLKQQLVKQAGSKGGLDMSAAAKAPVVNTLQRFADFESDKEAMDLTGARCILPAGSVCVCRHVLRSCAHLRAREAWQHHSCCLRTTTGACSACIELRTPEQAYASALFVHQSGMAIASFAAGTTWNLLFTNSESAPIPVSAASMYAWRLACKLQMYHTLNLGADAGSALWRSCHACIVRVLAAAQQHRMHVVSRSDPSAISRLTVVRNCC